MDSSMRSRQTGQVGSSIREGVGGGAGFVGGRVAAVVDEEGVDFEGADGVVAGAPGGGEEVRAMEGVKGSLVMSGKEEVCPHSLGGRRKEMDLTKTIWQFSG